MLTGGRKRVLLILVPLAPATLSRLEELAAQVREKAGIDLQPMQLAALLLEKSSAELSAEEARRLLGA